MIQGIFRHWDNVDNNKAGVTWHMLSLGASRRGDVIDTNSIYYYFEVSYLDDYHKFTDH